MNRIMKSWDSATIEEREEFLKELDKRYTLTRLCRALTKTQDRIIKNFSKVLKKDD